MINPNLFPGQQQEKIHLILREHWFRLFMRLLVWLLFLLILIAFDKYAAQLLPGLFTDPYLGYILLARNIYVIFLILGLFMVWALYYLNIEIVTEHRIIDVEQQSLFSHTVSQLDLESIEDVTSETTGFFETIFSYGNVNVQTAGAVDRFTFYKIPRPDQVERLIVTLYEQRKKAIGNTEE